MSVNRYYRLLRLKTFLFILFFSTYQYTQAQQASIRISPSTLEIKSVLGQIEKQSGIHFMYSGLDKELSRKVTLSPAAGSLEQILSQLSERTSLSFKQAGNTVAIKLKTPVKIQYGQLQGVVSDMDGKAVASATVSMNPGNETLATDENGRFLFRGLEIGKYTMTVSHVNYGEKKESVSVRSEKTANVHIHMDSLNKNSVLNPVVITGQYRPQSIDKSIYHVEVIEKWQIDNMAVSSVAELLRQQLNIEIQNDRGTGRSKIKMLGLNSQYVKILMDNIPIAGDQNMGNDVDLSTISLDDVERVEIVKSAMGVEYGANSIGGVINIITKKTARNRTDLRLDLQEETVGKEYNWKGQGNGKGRHIQRLSVTQRITDQITLGVAGSRDRFNGFWDSLGGSGIISQQLLPDNPELNGTGEIYTRGYTWSPKTSTNVNSWLSYSGKNFSLYYDFNYFNSMLTNYANYAASYTLPLEQVMVNASYNDDYKNIRYNHHLSARGSFWHDAYFTLDGSYQRNGLMHRRQAINLYDNSVLDSLDGIPGSTRLTAMDWEKYYQAKGTYAKGSVVKPIIKDKLEYNLGFEMDNTTGNSGYTSYFNDVTLSTPQEHSLFTGGVYTSAEWSVTDRIMIRPGYRINFSGQLDQKSNYSVTTRYRLDKHNDLRLMLGTSSRYPTFEELYMNYVDVIHNYHGNPDLKPEYGKSVELQWAFHKDLNSALRLETSLSGMYQHINDRIIEVTLADSSGHLTGDNTYANENKYDAWSGRFNVNMVSDKFALALAGSLLAYKGDDASNSVSYNKFLTMTEASAQATYAFPFDIRFSLFYRYVGRQPMFSFVQKSQDVNSPDYDSFYRVLSKSNAYNNMDINLAKRFFKKKVELRLGVRDLFNLTTLTYTPVSVPAELTNYSGSTLPVYYLFYGRSFFLKLTYNIF